MEPPATPASPAGAGPLAWLRRRRSARKKRSTDAVRRRVVDRLTALGPEWRVLDARPDGGSDGLDLLVIGPGGIFTVDVQHQGRTKIMLAGDVIQIDGRRPRLVASARRRAKRAAAALSQAAGTSIPVIPVIVFVGSGQLSMQGLPRGCIVAHDRELARILAARGTFLSAPSVERLHTLAADAYPPKSTDTVPTA